MMGRCRYLDGIEAGAYAGLRRQGWRILPQVKPLLTPSAKFPLFRPVLPLAGLALLVALETAGAFAQLELRIATLAAPQWRARQLSFSFDWRGAAAGYRLEIARLELPALGQTLENLEIRCRQGALDDRYIRCGEGEVRLSHPRLGRGPMALSFELERGSGRLQGTLLGAVVAGGRLDLDFALEAGDWRLGLRGKGLQPASLASLWPGTEGYLGEWGVGADLDLELSLSGRGERLHRGRWRGKLSQLGFADAAGTYAGEGLAANLEGTLSASGGAWRAETRLALEQGELLTPVCYLDAGVHPLQVEGRLSLDPQRRLLSFEDLRLRSRNLLDLNLQGALKLDAERPLQRLQLQVHPLRAEDLYGELLQPVLAGTPWGRFDMAGEVGLSLALEGEAVSLDLELREFDLDDTQGGAVPGHLGLSGVNGRLFWNRHGAARPSRLAWRSGLLLQHLDLGPGEIEFRAADSGFHLDGPARLPLLDGFLVVDRLDIEALGDPSQRLRFDGFLEPVSLEAVSRALGWVPLSGKLSGMLPGLTYENGLFSVEGVLLARVFDGDILIRNLQTRDLFGAYPQLQAEIELRNLDLETLTETFSFGRITGRLDGYVNALHLEAWRPVSFDARFYTPQGDSSSRRISQKAVDNISNLGGAGFSGSLARGFLGLFEEFYYKRIGIGCRLRQGVCEMTGAGKAKQGYYLVQGSGIPHVDIIGYNKTADWERVVEQLKQIDTAGEAEQR